MSTRGSSEAKSELRGKETPLAVVALGGHAFMCGGQAPSVEVYQRNAADIAAVLVHLAERGFNLVISHGNGPQIGHLLLQADLTRDDVPSMPLDVLVADTEGRLGYILQQALLNQLRRRKLQRYVVTMITQVLVDESDPAFQRPSKPVGPFYTREEAERWAVALGWNVMEDAGRGWRRAVPSPKPRQVVQWRMIRDSALAGHIVVAAGGGGIPIVKDAQGDFQGVEAVIDKDLTSSILAASIGADLLLILTDVPNVYARYGQPDQQALGAVTMQEAAVLARGGHFAGGSMLPKIEAVLAFLECGGQRALITDPPSLAAALEGRAGTHFVGRV